MESNRASRKLKSYWTHFWMLFAGLNPLGRVATLLATITAPPFYQRKKLAQYNAHGFISPYAKLYHSNLRLGSHVFIDSGVVIYQNTGGGPIDLGDDVVLQHNVILETGQGGSIILGNKASVAFGCHLSAFIAPIQIDEAVRIAQGCALYSHNHGNSRKTHFQLKTKGPIILEYGVWLGAKVIVLSGVRIGREAAIAAGSVVTKNIPAGTVAGGNPARVLKIRGE